MKPRINTAGYQWTSYTLKERSANKSPLTWRGVSKNDLALHGVWESPESQDQVVDLSKSQSVLFTSLFTDMVKVTTLTAHSTEHETK